MLGSPRAVDTLNSNSGSAAMNGDEAAIRELVFSWMQATKDGDLKKVLDLMTEDVVFLTCGNRPMRGRAAYEAAARSGIRAGTIDGESTIDEIHVEGGWAWMSTELRVTLTPL